MEKKKTIGKSKGSAGKTDANGKLLKSNKQREFDTIVYIKVHDDSKPGDASWVKMRYKRK